MKIVCAYSGGLDTSCMIPWLKEHYDAEIITYPLAQPIWNRLDVPELLVRDLMADHESQHLVCPAGFEHLARYKNMLSRQGKGVEILQPGDMHLEFGVRSLNTGADPVH